MNEHLAARPVEDRPDGDHARVGGLELSQLRHRRSEAGQRHDHLLTDQETAVVPISGSATVKVGGIETCRTSVFEEMPRIAYAPPGVAIEIVAIDEAFDSPSSAPAEAHPARHRAGRHVQ